MYAVIKTGGKQYRVAKDDVIFVEKLTAEPGAKVELDEVLLVDEGKGPVVGAPLVDGAKVAATVLEQKRGDKIIVFKKKRRKNHRRMRGHRQDITVLRITDILPKGKKATRSRAKATKDDEAPAAVEEPAATEAEAAPKEEAAPKATAKPRTRAKPKASADKADAKDTAPKKPRARRTTKKDDDAAGSEETS